MEQRVRIHRNNTIVSALKSGTLMAYSGFGLRTYAWMHTLNIRTISDLLTHTSVELFLF